MNWHASISRCLGVWFQAQCKSSYSCYVCQNQKRLEYQTRILGFLLVRSTHNLHEFLGDLFSYALSTVTVTKYYPVDNLYLIVSSCTCLTLIQRVGQFFSIKFNPDRTIHKWTFGLWSVKRGVSDLTSNKKNWLYISVQKGAPEANLPVIICWRIQTYFHL